MTTTYKIVDLKDAPEDYEGELETWYDSEYVRAVVRCEDGIPVERIGTDGGEAEDQTLGRDWSWVASALQAAYDLGRTQTR